MSDEIELRLFCVAASSWSKSLAATVDELADSLPDVSLARRDDGAKTDEWYTMRKVNMLFCHFPNSYSYTVGSGPLIK